MQKSAWAACTERNCFPYSQPPRLKPAAPLAGKWRFQGVFRTPPFMAKFAQHSTSWGSHGSTTVSHDGVNVMNAMPMST